MNTLNRKIRVIKRGMAAVMTAQPKPDKPKFTLKQSVENFLFDGMDLKHYRVQKERESIAAMAAFAQR